MSESRDERQDRMIRENTENIGVLIEYVRELKNHFIPAVEEARFRRIAKYAVLPVVKALALFAFIAGLWDCLGWVIDRYEISCMAKRYAQVAQAIYQQENNPQVAATFLDKAIELADGNADFRFLRAYMQGMAATRTLLNVGRPLTKAELDCAHAALAEAKFLEGLKPKRSEPYILQSQILAALGEQKRAKELIEKAVALDPANDFAQVRLALVLLNEKDLQGAEAALDLALTLSPGSKWALLWKGIVAQNYRRDLDTARLFYGKALAVDPKFDMALYNFGATYVVGEQKDYATARKYYFKALKVNPDYKEACYAIGMTYGYEDNYMVAKVWMEKAVALDPGFLIAHKFLGVVLGEMKDFEGAISSYDAALHLDPMNADIYVRKAKMELALDRNDEALRDLEFAYGLDPVAKRTLLYLGDLKVKCGDLDTALEYYDKALAVDDKYAEAYAGRAAVLYRQGKKAEAIEAIDTAEKSTTYKPERFRKIKEKYKQ